MARTDLVASVRDLAGIETEWRDLVWHSSIATPFQDPAWLLSWWDRFGAGASAARLATYTWRVDGGLVAILPAAVRETSRGRELRLLGEGVSDYLQIVCEADAAGATDATKDWLRELFASGARDGAWDLIAFHDVPEAASPLLAAARQIGAMVEPSNVAPRATLRSDGLPEGITHGLHKSVRRGTRRLEKMGTLRCAAATSPEEREFLLAGLMRLHGDRWNVRSGLPGVLADRDVQAFHRLVLARYPTEALRLYGLWSGEQLIAAMYGFINMRTRTFYSYLTGWEPAFAIASPGDVLFAETMKLLAREGVTCFDFLRGSEPYKYLWGASDRPLYTIRSEPAIARAPYAARRGA